METLRNATSGSDPRHMIEGYLSSSHLTGRRLAGEYPPLTYWEDSATEYPVPASRISTHTGRSRGNFGRFQASIQRRGLRLSEKQSGQYTPSNGNFLSGNHRYLVNPAQQA